MAEVPAETEEDTLPLPGPDKAGVPAIAEPGITVVVGLLLLEANMAEPVVPDQGKVAAEVPALSVEDRTVAGVPALAVERRPAIEVQVGGDMAGSAAPLIEEHRLVAMPLPVGQLQNRRKDLLGRDHRAGKVPALWDHHRAGPDRLQTDPFSPLRKLVLAGRTHC